MAVLPADANELRQPHASESAFEQAQREFLDWCTPDFVRGLRVEFDRILDRPIKTGIAIDRRSPHHRTAWA